MLFAVGMRTILIVTCFLLHTFWFYIIYIPAFLCAAFLPVKEVLQLCQAVIYGSFSRWASSIMQSATCYE